MTTMNEILSNCEDLEKLEEIRDIKNATKESLNLLSPRQRRIIELHFGLDDGIKWTYEKIGREFGVTRERIRQIVAKALLLMLQGKEPPNTKCLNCGRIVGNILIRGRKFCNDKCRVEHYKEKLHKVLVREKKTGECLNCGNKFTIGKKKKFCSFECGVLYNARKNTDRQRALYDEFKQWKKKRTKS